MKELKTKNENGCAIENNKFIAFSSVLERNNNTCILYIYIYRICNQVIGVWSLKAPFATKVICFSCLLKCLRSLFGKQCGSRSDSYRSSVIGAVCSGTTLFASILNSSVMLGNYLQQTSPADNIFRCIFFLALKGLMKAYRICNLYNSWSCTSVS